MTAYISSLLRLLDERGYIHQLTDAAALDALAEKEVITAYIGFDATAPSLHVGSLVQIMLLRRLQQSGHKPVVLMGGGTTLFVALRRGDDAIGIDKDRQAVVSTDLFLRKFLEGERIKHRRKAERVGGVSGRRWLYTIQLPARDLHAVLINGETTAAEALMKDIPGGARADLVAWLRGRGEEYAYAFEDPGVVRAAIDRVHVKPDAPIAGAGEIAFFPPMTGG